jgi:hypothetical protein
MAATRAKPGRPRHSRVETFKNLHSDCVLQTEHTNFALYKHPCPELVFAVWKFSSGGMPDLCACQVGVAKPCSLRDNKGLCILTKNQKEGLFRVNDSTGPHGGA